MSRIGILCLVIGMALFSYSAWPHCETYFEGPKVIVLTNGRTFFCPGGIEVEHNRVRCYRDEHQKSDKYVALFLSTDIAEICSLEPGGKCSN